MCVRGTLVKNTPSWAYSKPTKSALSREGLAVHIYNKLPDAHESL